MQKSHNNALLEYSDNDTALNLIAINKFACPMCETPHRFQLKWHLSLFSSNGFVHL